jgi:hypothetical protein
MTKVSSGRSAPPTAARGRRDSSSGPADCSVSRGSPRCRVASRSKACSCTPRNGPTVSTSRAKTSRLSAAARRRFRCLPYSAAHAKHTYAFIRTPSHVLPKAERMYGDADRVRFASGSSEQLEIRNQLSDEMEDIARARFPMNDAFIESIEAKWRAFMHAEIADPALRAILTPNYRFSCRRPLVSNAYYPVFNQANVTAIGSGLASLTEHEAVAEDGRTFHVDAVLLRDRLRCREHARPLSRDRTRRARSRARLEGLPGSVSRYARQGFPNLFLINGPNLGAPAVTEIVEAQTKYIASCLDVRRRARRRQYRSQSRRARSVQPRLAIALRGERADPRWMYELVSRRRWNRRRVFALAEYARRV